MIMNPPHGEGRRERARTGTCQKPPPGWACTRGAGHDGPCAAVRARGARARRRERTGIAVCRNPRCGETLGYPYPFRLCASCWFAAKIGLAGGGAIVAAIAGALVAWFSK